MHTLFNRLDLGGKGRRKKDLADGGQRAAAGQSLAGCMYLLSLSLRLVISLEDSRRRRGIGDLSLGSERPGGALRLRVHSELE